MKVCARVPLKINKIWRYDMNPAISGSLVVIFIVLVAAVAR
jgi:hypothetical protein